MKVEIRLFASFTRYLPPNAEGQKAAMDLDEGTTIKDVLTHLGVPLDTVKLVFANGVHANMDYVIQEGDRIGAFPPVAGG
ncbi:MAG: MoaD/ThiS family protein [Proteobacteria bacterium]|nr:MoaD/ThiS family protein [Pseudomonadota bacterium]